MEMYLFTGTLPLGGINIFHISTKGHFLMTFFSPCCGIRGLLYILII